MELDGARVLLRVDDAGARYPLVVDPVLQTAKLTASDGAAVDSLGQAIAIGGDTVAVGAHLDDIGASANRGSVYVFVKPAVRRR